MPIYSVQGPDGRIYDIEGPDGASDAQVVSALRNHLASLPPPEEAPKPKTGLGAAVGKGVESIISSGRTAFGAATGDAEEAARAGLERGEALNKKYADQVSLQKVKDAYNKDGVLSAAGEALSQIPAALAEQAPNLAAMAGSARLGAAAGSVLGPVGSTVGATVGGIGGALLPSLIQQFGGNVERQAAEQQQAGRPLSIDVGAAGAAAIPQAGLDVAGSLIPFGGRLVQKLTGIPMGALLSRSAEGAAKLADERLLTVLAKGVGVGALAEIPTEITQQMLERAQAGLSLSSPDALREYGETAYQVGLLAPLGAVGRLSERGGARMDVAAKQQEEAAQAATVQQQQAAVAAQQKATADAQPAYAEELRQDYIAANVEMQRLNQAVKALSAEKDPLSVADAKDARVARDTYAKETMQPLVDEIRRVRQLHPGVDFRPPPAVAPAAAPAVAAAAVEPVVTQPLTTVTPMPEAPAAPLTKAQAAEGTVSEPAPFTAPAAAPARMEEIQSHVEAIMGSPEIAAEMVANNEQVPGLTPEENALFLEMLQQRLAQEELTGEVAVPTGAEAVPAKKAKGKKAAGTEPTVTRATPPTDPDTMWSPTVTLDYGAYTIENDGQYPTYSFKTPLAVTPQASLQQLRVTEDRAHLLFTNSKGEKVRISVAPDHIRMENQTTDALQDYDFGSGKNSPTLTALFGADLLDQLNKTAAENRLPTFLSSLTQRLGLANLDRFTQEYADMLGGKPLVEKAKSKKAVAETPVAKVPVEETPVAKAPTTPPPTLQDFEEQRVKLEAVANDTSQPYRTRVDAKLELAAIPKKMAQFTLEQREEPTTPTGESIPRTAISFEPRRRLMDAIAKEADYAPDKRRALEALSNDFSKPYNVRAAAKTQLETYNAKVQKTIANKEKTLGTDIELYAKTRGNIAAAENALANELLNKNELTRLRGGKITRAALEAPKRAKLAGTLARLNAELTVRADKIAARSGLTKEQVKRTLLPTKAQIQAKAEDTLRRTRGAPVTDKFEEYYAEQPKQREIGPVSRPDVYPPREFKLGTAEASAQTRTTPEKISVKRGEKQRDVQITKKEMAAANAAAPGATMGPAPETAMQALRQEQQLFEIAQKKVEDLSAKLTNIKERVAGYGRLDPKVRKQAVADKLAAEQKSIETELAGAKTDATKTAPKTEAVSKQTLGEFEDESENASVVGQQTKGKTNTESEDAKLRGTSGPNDTPLSANNIDLLGGNKLAAVLTNISEKSSNHVARRIAGKLAAVVEVNDVNVKLVQVTAEDSPDAPGSTSRDGNRVRINENTGLSEETVVHEAAHAATMFELDKPDSALTSNQRKAKEELNRMRDSVLADEKLDNKVIKDGDLHEFVAEGLASRAVQSYMRGKQWEGRSLWQRFKDGVLRLIGVNTPAKGPMLDRFLDLAENFIAAKAENAPSVEKTKLRSVGSLLGPKDVKYANPGLAAAGATGDTFIAKDRGAIDRVRAASGGFLGLETQLVDRFAPLERVSKGMDALKGSQMMYYLRMYDQRMNYTAQSVANGAIQRVAKQRKDGRTEYVVESVDGANIQQVVDILKKAPAGSPDAANRLFTMYLAGIRAKNKGFQTLHFGDALTEAQLDSAMASIRATPGLEENFKQARDVYNEYNRNMVGFLEQSGAISKAHAARLTKENDYIPFYREQNGVALLTIGGEAPIRIGSIAEQPYLHELVGGDRPILDFLTSSVQNTALITDMGLRNLATKNSMNELEAIGLAQIRPGPGTADTKTVRFKMYGDDYHAIVDTDSAGVPADLLVKGMQGIPTQLPVLVRALGFPATLLRRAVTLSPTYAARQLFRDSLAAPLLSGADFVPVLGALGQLGKSATKSTLEKRGITGGQIFAGGSSSEAITKVINDMMSGKGNLGSLIAKAEALNMAADAATRRAQYNSYIKQGLSEMEATLMSLESMNFNKRGASPSVHMANALIPFFNSQIQGLNVLYKALTGKMPFDKRLKIQEKLVTRGALMFGASLAYAALMQDDEAYKNATPEQKYGNWFIRISGIDEPIKAPIPFEVGYLFKALPEALYNSMANESGSEEAFKALKTIILQTIPGGSSYFIPQAVKPAIEYGMGKSFYTGRDILSRREQAVLPEQQFREGSSEISKMMGSGLGLSPIKIEALVSGYTGTMGLALMQVLSMGVPTGESPEKTTKRLSDMPVIGSSFQPNDAGGIINAVYERMNDVKKVKTTVDRMLSEGRVAEAKELISQRSEEFAQSGVADYFTSNMQQITKYENAIRASNLTGDEKQAKLAEMRQMKIRLAEMVRKATDEAKSVG